MRDVSRKLAVGLMSGMLLMAVGCGPEDSAEQAPMTFSSPDPLIESLESSQSNTRAFAARELGKMGAQAASALPALEEALEVEQDQDVREAMEKAIAAIRDGG